MLKNVSLVVLLVLGLACASYAADIYVNAAAVTGGDGSMLTPFKTLQDALAVANTNGTTDTIHMAEGKYTPDPNATGWTVSQAVTILGGYSGLYTAYGPTLPFEFRMPHAYSTVLSGDVLGNDIDVNLYVNPMGLSGTYDPNDPNDPGTTNRHDNKLAFNSVTAAATFDGLYFSNFGTASPGGTGSSNSAGVGCNAGGAAVVINDCVFTKCACTCVIYVDADNVSIKNCRFEDNGVGRGCIRNNTGDSYSIDNCTFIGNSASSDYTGGLYIYRTAVGETYNITNCLFAESMLSGSSPYGPIIIYDRGGTFNITNCIFRNNLHTAGTLFYRTDAANTGPHALNITRCLFNKNKEMASNGTLLLRYTQVDPVNPSTVNIDHTVIADNRSNNAGGIKTEGSSTADSNWSINIKNSIIWGNKRANGTSTDSLTWNTAALQFTDNVNYNPFNLTYSCIDTSDPNNVPALQYGNETPRTGLVFTDPLFVDPNNNDYHLQATSPCIDAGVPGLAYVGDEPRPYNGYRQNIGLYGGTREAAVKANPCALTADSDNNGVVDLSDLSNLRLQWLKTCP